MIVARKSGGYCMANPRKFVLILITIVLVVNILPLSAQTTQPIKLGGFNVQAACNTEGYNAALTNNGNDWACVQKSDGKVVFVLTQSDYDRICRAVYGLPTAFALKQGSDPTPAYNWACYVYPAEYDVINAPNSQQKLGGLNVDEYCRDRGRRAVLVNNNNDWGCQNQFSNRIDLVLTQSDLNQICRETYSFDAFAVRDGGSGVPAYDWSCYQYVAPDFNRGPDTSNPITTFTPLGFLAAKPGYEVNVRAEPSLEAKKLGRINAASSYAYYGRTEEWYIINFYGQRGYVAAIWVRLLPNLCC
jgi:hypothetical protein